MLKILLLFLRLLQSVVLCIILFQINFILKLIVLEAKKKFSFLCETLNLMLKNTQIFNIKLRVYNLYGSIKKIIQSI
jgi:hypothetical protein